MKITVEDWKSCNTETDYGRLKKFKKQIRQDKVTFHSTLCRNTVQYSIWNYLHCSRVRRVWRTFHLIECKIEIQCAGIAAKFETCNVNVPLASEKHRLARYHMYLSCIIFLLVWTDGLMNFYPTRNIDLCTDIHWKAISSCVSEKTNLLCIDSTNI